MYSHIVEQIKREIEQFEPDIETSRVGRVIRMGDGIAEIEGLDHAHLSEMVVFDDSVDRSLEDAIVREDAPVGLLLNLEEDLVRAVILGETSQVREGMLVRGLGKLLSVPVGEGLVGRVVDSLGKPLDGKGVITGKHTRPLEFEAYGVIDRASVDTPLHTGIKAIDGMIPIGRGQRELIIGDRFTGKTTLAVDTIINQLNEPKAERPVCIYVAVGQKESKTARIVAELRERGAMAHTIVVSASSAAPAALQFLAPFAGAAMGEYFMEQGGDAVVIFDDLSKHAVAYRQLSLLLRRPPGREAYPGDIFYLHSRLLERSAKLSNALGGGSLTALPIIETQEGDVSSYIPTNVISITDGQIYLDTDLFNKDMRPAINVGLSVSRVGSSAQTKAMKTVAGKIRLQLAQFRELEAFMQFAQDLDEATKTRIEEGRRLSAILTQNKHTPLSMSVQVPMFYAAMHGLLDEVPSENIGKLEEQLLSFLDARHPELIQEIATEKEVTERFEKSFAEAFAQFKEAHKDLFISDVEQAK